MKEKMSSQILPLDVPLTGTSSQPPQKKTCKSSIVVLLESWYYQLILGIVVTTPNPKATLGIRSPDCQEIGENSCLVVATSQTIYALFGEDLRLLFMPKRFDDVLFSMHSVTFVIFAGEMFLRGYARPQTYIRCRNNFPTGYMHSVYGAI